MPARNRFKAAKGFWMICIIRIGSSNRKMPGFVIGIIERMFKHMQGKAPNGAPLRGKPLKYDIKYLCMDKWNSQMMARWCFGNVAIAKDGNANLKPMKNKSAERQMQ